jgi:hypothetical protein
MSFPSEMIRTSSNVAAQAVKEMKHSKPTRGSNILPVVYELGKGFVKNDNPFYSVGFKRAAGMATTLTVSRQQLLKVQKHYTMYPKKRYKP